MSAIEKLITDKLPLWSSSIQTKSTAGRGTSSKRNLYGVKKLRELILDLAMRGLLVPQDPNDEPINLFSKKMTEKKETLLNQYKIRYRNNDIPNEIKLMQYDLPEKWLWSRFDDVVLFQEGPGIRNWQFRKSGIKLLNVANILTDGTLDFDKTDKHIDEQEFEEKYSHFLIGNGDLLFASSGNSWGKFAWFKDPNYPVMLNTSTIRMRFFSDNFADRFLGLFLGTQMFKQQMNIQLVGMQPNFGSTHLGKISIPLPPLAEQHRIVAKVDQLMALCDTLEQQQEDSIQTHETLVETLLSALINAPNADAFQSAWQRISAHFDTLLTTQHSVNKLKETILQLAVMGKLVPQDPNDEPASVLLKKIATEKKRLIQNSMLKKERVLPQISEEDKLKDIPDNWTSVRLGDTGISSTGKTPSTKNNEYFDGEIPFIGPAQMTPDGKILASEKTLTEKGLKQSTEALIGSILMVCIGGSIGKNAIVDTRISFNQQINSIHPVLIIPKFLQFTVSVPFFYKNLIEKSCGSATPIINRSKWEELVIPVAPLAEQRRIVAKVDQLMALCDKLNQALKTAQSTKIRLTDTIVDNAISKDLRSN